ncbi:MAG TPA: response regulator transcription factor [Candidatus Limnocylindria bacterium]
MTSVLIVDDDRALVGMVAALLGAEGYDLITAYDGESALRRHAEEGPDLIILDRRLPRMSGDEICRRIRATAQTPILMLTGEKGEEERAALLDLGADDYLEKPFGRKELVARVRALLRRAKAPSRPAASTTIGGLAIDARSHSARMHGSELPLTPTEFRLLAALAARPGELVERKALLRAGWPDERDPDPEWLKAHLARLRSKLESAGAPVPANVRGVGYKLG